MPKPKGASRAVAKPTPAPRNREQLLDAIAPLLEQVDQLMAKRSTGYGQVNWSYSYGTPIVAIADKLRPLVALLDELLRGNNEEADAPGASAAICERFATAPGEPLTWSKPGSFLAWMGDIPIRCFWGGYVLKDETALFALDRSRLFLTPDGSRAVTPYAIPNDARRPEDLMRAALRQAVTPDRYRHDAGGLAILSADALRKLDGFMADPSSAWWAEAVSSSPVDPISIPLNIPPVQKNLQF